MASKRILICGAGISGSILAFWLAKSNFQIVAIERSRPEQRAGQGPEIEEPALTVVREMGVMSQLEAVKTGELGFALEDSQSRTYALFKAGGFSPTGALEMMRGDMTEVFYKSADAHENVKYIYGTTIHSLRQTQDEIFVYLQDRVTKSITTEEFDLVVGADGAKSRTRDLVMGSPEQINCYQPIGACVAYFSIPNQDHDWPYSRLCHFGDRRLMWLRPTGENRETTSVYLIQCKANVSALREANATGDRTKQKEGFAQIFRDCGWETPRVIKEMMTTDNFYSDELVQVKLDSWSCDRVVLLGDSAWAPTPFTGEGNQLAIIGAYVLAQELARDPTPAAFVAYEKRLREYVENGQHIPFNKYLWVPHIINPDTMWGVWVFGAVVLIASWVFRFIAWAGLPKLVSDKGEQHAAFDLQLPSSRVKN